MQEQDDDTWQEITLENMTIDFIFFIKKMIKAYFYENFLFYFDDKFLWAIKEWIKSIFILHVILFFPRVYLPVDIRFIHIGDEQFILNFEHCILEMNSGDFEKLIPISFGDNILNFEPRIGTDCLRGSDYFSLILIRNFNVSLNKLLGWRRGTFRRKQQLSAGG